jgi:hypothetical protein
MPPSHINPKAYTLAQRLASFGIPLDQDELERMRAAHLGLSIRESGPSFAFNLQSGGAGYVFNALIWNNSKRRLCIEHVGFDAQWGSRFGLLSDPHKEYPLRFYKHGQCRHGRGGELDYLTAREVYTFPDTLPHRYERDSVINHATGRGRVFFPGDPLEGFLLVVGAEQIPWNYADGDRLEVKLTVFWQRGSHAVRFHPSVERSPGEKQFMAKMALPDLATNGAGSFASQVANKHEPLKAYEDQAARGESERMDPEAVER